MTLRELLRQASRIGAAGLPVAAAAGVGAGGFAIAGAEEPAAALAQLVRRVPRELGPLLAAAVVAVRVGAAIAGELAGLRAGQQLDWLRAAGLSPARELAAPRVLAAALVLPVLALVVDATALGTGWAVASSLGVDAGVFASLAQADVWIGLVRAAAFGVALAAVASAIGLATARDVPVAQAAGRGGAAALLGVAALAFALRAGGLA